MFALGIRYLMGWAMAAADGANKQQAEWPPHPDRVFMALAAAWFETEQEAHEGEALRWLESLPAPELSASGHTTRQVVTHFVPVNDSASPFEDEKTGKLAMPSGDLQLGRPRRPRNFPVAVPHDPLVHLIWRCAIPERLRGPLDSLCRKVSSIGHSSSLAQMWVENAPPQPTLVPAAGITRHRLRIFGPGRMSSLESRMNRQAWVSYCDLRAQIDQAKEGLAAIVRPPRSPWGDFPDVVLLADESTTKHHRSYRAAKAGNAQAATELVRQLVDDAGLERVRRLIAAGEPVSELTLVCAHAYERDGVNAIPAALAELLSERLGITYEAGIVQTNVVSHTGADGYGRLARQAKFDGAVRKDRTYLMVDDFVGQGGTLANLRGHILKKGAAVSAAVCLTGKPYSAKLRLEQEQLHELRQRHGNSLENWWREHFGHPFDHLTQSEARYLARSPDADEIRNRITAAKRAGGDPGCARSTREQQRLIEQLEAQLAERYPHGPPHSLRPEPGFWQGYATPSAEPALTPIGSIFDARLVVLTFVGKRLPLPATLKLTEALRGALLKACPPPIPEWASGHDTSGGASNRPHVAMLPLAFVGGQHGDGRIMGVALALPRDLDPEEANRVLEAWLRDAHTGRPRPIRLFDGQWLEVTAELETRETSPDNLDPETWTAPETGACRWASVTPVVLDRHFKGADKWEKAAESIKDACERIDLPRPELVELHPVSRVRGAPRATEFPYLTRKRDGGRMDHTHAYLQFVEPVRGPVLIGAGRFRGYGLCRPLSPYRPRPGSVGHE